MEICPWLVEKSSLLYTLKELLFGKRPCFKVSSWIRFWASSKVYQLSAADTSVLSLTLWTVLDFNLCRGFSFPHIWTMQRTLERNHSFIVRWINRRFFFTIACSGWCNYTEMSGFPAFWKGLSIPGHWFLQERLLGMSVILSRCRFGIWDWHGTNLAFRDPWNHGTFDVIGTFSNFLLFVTTLRAQKIPIAIIPYTLKIWGKEDMDIKYK